MGPQHYSGQDSHTARQVSHNENHFLRYNTPYTNRPHGTEEQPRISLQSSDSYFVAFSSSSGSGPPFFIYYFFFSSSYNTDQYNTQQRALQCSTMHSTILINPLERFRKCVCISYVRFFHPRPRWSEVTRKLEMWVQILELNENGEYVAVEAVSAGDVRTGGVFQLRQVALTPRRVVLNF